MQPKPCHSSVEPSRQPPGKAGLEAERIFFWVSEVPGFRAFRVKSGVRCFRTLGFVALDSWGQPWPFQRGKNRKRQDARLSGLGLQAHAVTQKMGEPRRELRFGFGAWDC